MIQALWHQYHCDSIVNFNYLNRSWTLCISHNFLWSLWSTQEFSTLAFVIIDISRGCRFESCSDQFFSFNMEGLRAHAHGFWSNDAHKRGTHSCSTIYRMMHCILRVELSRFAYVQSTLRSLVSNFGKSGEKRLLCSCVTRMIFWYAYKQWAIYHDRFVAVLQWIFVGNGKSEPN